MLSLIKRTGVRGLAWGLLLSAVAPAAWGQGGESPWGVASSAGGYRDHGQWMPKAAEAGVTTVRLFPEWGTLEPSRGAFKWDAADALVKAAGENRVEINAVLLGRYPWGKDRPHTFPVDHLDDWSNYVSAAAGRYKGKIRYWEVWNEANGGFNGGQHTTADYARLAAATYEAAKRADPEAKVGLSVASFDPAYLMQAILAMAKQGKADHFDFLAIHPYEVADGIREPDGEVPFLWMTRTLREMLKAGAPAKADAEVWITEVSRRVENRKGHVVTPEEAARALVKIYVMALAQGVRRTQWFEARDPAGEDAGFGLMARDGSPRAAYKALATMTAVLGPAPKYVGWLAVGKAGRGYGFVFQGAKGPVLVAWMPAGETETSLVFPADVEGVGVLKGERWKVPANQAVALTDEPVYFVGIPAESVAAARANAAGPFPWGGDFSKAPVVGVTLGRAGGENGMFQRDRASTPRCTFADGSTGIILRGDQGVGFWVHPSFAGFDTKEYYVRVTVRRLAPGNLGMNLHYEVADSQGRTPYKNRGEWYSVPKEDGWHAHTWRVTDACFAKMWGYDLVVRAEQSVPFVIGKVEVSRGAFE